MSEAVKVVLGVVLLVIAIPTVGLISGFLEDQKRTEVKLEMIKSNILIKNLSSMTNIMDIVCGLRD